MKLSTITKMRENVRFSSINYDAVKDPALSKSEKDTLVVLSMLARKKRICWPSIRSICLILDLNPRTNERNTRRRLSKLEQLGYIIRCERYANDNGTGRQRSNCIHLNYDCSLTKIQPHHMNLQNPWDIILLRKNLSTDSYNKFTPPIYRSNRYINNIIIGNFEKSYPHPEESPLPELSLAQAFAPAGESVDSEFPHKKVYNWFKRPVRYFPSKRSGFVHLRSKYGEIRHMEKKDLPAKAEIKNSTSNGSMTNEEFENRFVVDYRNPVSNKNTGPHVGDYRPEDDPKVKEVLATFPGSKIVGIELSTYCGDKSVDNLSESLSTLASNGTNISWKDICKEVVRLNPQFAHWHSQLQYVGIYRESITLSTSNQFMKDSVENRFKDDILNACRILKIDAQYLEIENRR